MNFMKINNFELGHESVLNKSVFGKSFCEKLKIHVRPYLYSVFIAKDFESINSIRNKPCVVRKVRKK